MTYREALLDKIIEKVKPEMNKAAAEGYYRLVSRQYFTPRMCSILNEDDMWNLFVKKLKQMDIHGVVADNYSKCSCNGGDDEDEDKDNKNHWMEITFRWD